MANKPSKFKSESLDRDTLLCIEHMEYMRQVTESGVPLWVAQMYEQARPQPVDLPQREDHGQDSKMPPAKPDLPF